MFNLELEVLATVIRQQKETKGVQISKEEVNFSLFTDDMILYIESPKIPPPNYKTSYSNLVMWQDTKSIYRNQLLSYSLTMKIQKGKLENQFHLL